MSKFIKIEYYPSTWSDKHDKVVCYKDKNGQPCKLLLSLDSIKAVASSANFIKLFESYEDTKREDSVSKLAALHNVTTDIAYGRGINGVDFSSYFITSESYERLASAIEIV